MISIETRVFLLPSLVPNEMRFQESGRKKSSSKLTASVCMYTGFLSPSASWYTLSVPTDQRANLDP